MHSGSKSISFFIEKETDIIMIRLQNITNKKQRHIFIHHIKQLPKKVIQLFMKGCMGKLKSA